METLEWVMQKDNVRFLAKHNTDKRFTYLFFNTPLGMKLFKENNYILILDSTYKTNRFSMPLFYIVGCTGMSTMFQVSVCFMRNKKEREYQWVIE